MEIIGGFFMPPITMEDNMTRKDVHYIHIKPEISREKRLQVLVNHLKKQGWTILDDEKKEKKEIDNGKNK